MRAFLYRYRPVHSNRRKFHQVELLTLSLFLKIYLTYSIAHVNVYHAPLSCGGFVCDIGRAIDQVMFDLELKVSDFEISPAYQWAFDRAISAFAK